MAEADELKLDPQNARRHSERNAALVRQSLQEVGPFRSIAVDGDNVIRAGNLTYQEAQALGLKTRVIEAAPDELIVVKRPDLRGDAARRAGLWDNRTGDPDVGSEWDPEVLAQMMAEEPALLEGVLGREKLDVLLGNLPDEGDWADAFGALPDGERAPFQQMTFTLHDSQVEQVKAALGASKRRGEFVDSPNENSNGNALARICETFLTEHGQSEGHHTQAN